MVLIDFLNKTIPGGGKNIFSRFARNLAPPPWLKSCVRAWNPTCIKFIIHHNICIHSFQNLHPSFNIHIHYPSCIDNCAYLMLYLNPTFINNYIHPLTYILNIRINYLTFISSLDQQSNPNCIQFMKKSSILISILRSNL